ncbi:hypothetical protein PENVUL_c001G02669 [Penicillium vulpinum]|uniref:Uncharacterized protein n=1 Tax=Penicillium vulpinum TaxID=29845 RepID=A0A1V6SEW0_9EURO|nr:hypothetical protein PENVUL_c001G02669 [Penicillium vulpinum]
MFWQSYPFDEHGDVYGRGEAAVALVLKRLDDAVRDGNPVRTIIRNSAIGQDQIKLARMTYNRAGLLPKEVAYIEAHGIGTKAGDHDALNAIAEAFGSSQGRPVPLSIGSTKGSMSHGGSAAGLSSSLKAAVILDCEFLGPPILVLRLVSLNCAIANSDNTGAHTGAAQIVNSERPLVLSPDGAELFVEDHETFATPLPADLVEIQANNLAIMEHDSSAKMGSYAAFVAIVGSNVTSLALGDHVIALLGTPKAAAMLLETMAASYAIREVGRILPRRVTVLIHGACTAISLAFFLSLLSANYLLVNSIDANCTGVDEWQDSLAHQEQPHPSPGTHFMTVNLDWPEDTLPANNDDTQIQDELRRVGLELIRSDHPTRRHSFDAESLASATAPNGPIHSALFREARGGINGGKLDDGDYEEEQSFEQVIAAGNEDAVAEFILRAITRKISQFLSVDVGTVDEILALGLDSLVAVELPNWILKRFEATLQSSDMLRNQTPRALAEKFGARSSLVNALA